MSTLFPMASPPRAEPYSFGTAGWSYADWEGIVYPQKKPGNFNHLLFLAQNFDFVEVNTSFYRIPSEKLVSGWLRKTESIPNFKFWIKVFQNFTHKRVLDKNEVNTFINSVKPLADVEFPIKPGESINVRVVEKGNQLKMSLDMPKLKQSAEFNQIINKIEILSEDIVERFKTDVQRVIKDVDNLARNQEFINQLKTQPDAAKNLALLESAQKALAKVDGHFEPFNLGSDILKIVTKLRALIKNSGTFFEKNLESALAKLSEVSTRILNSPELARSPEIADVIANDLKPNLLVLKQFFANERIMSELNNPRQVENMKTSIDDLLNNINSQQNTAVDKQAQAQDPVQVFNFTLPLKESKKKAKLKVYYNKKKKGKGKRSYRISLLLALERVGDIRTDFYLIDKNLNITFYVRDHKIKEYIDQNINEINFLLKDLFSYLILKVIVSEKKIQEFDTEDIEIITDRMVDVKV